jgi:hypothetical protein
MKKKNMIYFVGIHNKPGMTALDSRTYTGKIIDMIIAKVGKGVKTNLADTDSMPKWQTLNVWAWHDRHSLVPGDTVVLLGKFTQKHFDRKPGIIHIEVDHPSAFRVRADVAGYVERVAEQINRAPTDGQRLARLMEKHALIESGNAGVDKNGSIVDIRENPEAVKMPTGKPWL